MSLPHLTGLGFLPSGVYACSIGDVHHRFGWNSRRRELLDKLDVFRGWLSSSHGLACDFFIGGSFVTSKPNPGDIDFVIDLSSSSPTEAAAAIALFVDSRTQLKKEFEIDYWFCHERATQPLSNYFMFPRLEEVLRMSLPMDSRRGVLRVCAQ